jgi:DNA-binding transcriptional LysR family regulator
VYAGDLLEHLRSFVVLARVVEDGRSGAFARAAQELAVDLSVLRRRIQALSAHLGAPLLEGRGDTLRLTPAGDRVRTHGIRALDAVSELTTAARNEAGPLRIACTGTILAEVLPPVLRSMRDEHPALSFRVRRAGAESSRALLARGDVDFAVVRGTNAPDGIASKNLGPDRLFVAIPWTNRLAKRDPSLEELAREPLVGYGATSSTMRRVLDVLGPLGASPWIEVDGKAAALSYVAEGLGIAFVSALAGQTPERKGVAFCDVTADFAPIAFWLVWPERTAHVQWQKRFIELVGEQVRGG